MAIVPSVTSLAPRLKNKVAVITGGSSGIGLATAKLFAAEGAKIFITGRNRVRLDAAVSAIGSTIIPVQCDSADLSDLDHLYDIVKREAGRIDVLFASAGTGEPTAAIGKITGEMYDKIMGLNVRGTLFTVQKALPLLAEGGSIVLNGSMAGSKGFAFSSVYGASKAAVRSFARSWAVDLKKRRIRVNVVSPGTIETEAISRMPDISLEIFRSMIPRGAFGSPEEVAAAVLFLASDESSFINGVELAVDGGVAQI